MIRDSELIRLQEIRCARFGADFMETAESDVQVVSETVMQGLFPLNGLRHPPSGNTSGWYIWAGTKLSDAHSFFRPFHARHIRDLCPQLEPFLGLSPELRFLIADDYEDA